MECWTNISFLKGGKIYICWILGCFFFFKCVTSICEDTWMILVSQTVFLETWFSLYHIVQWWGASLHYLWLVLSFLPAMDVQLCYKVARVCVPVMICWRYVRTDATPWRTADGVVDVWAPARKTTSPATEAVCLCQAKSRMIKRSQKKKKKKRNCGFYKVMKIKSIDEI